MLFRSSEQIINSNSNKFQGNEKDDEEWSEQSINSNPQPPEKSNGGGGFDLKSILYKGLVGAVTGGLIALIFGVLSFFKKKEKG